MDRKEFARRRRQFMRMIGKEAIAILPSAPVRHRNGDIEYAYRQDSHFYYLTGFQEPDAVAVLAPGRPHAEYLLFVREHDALRESWDGPRAGTEGAVGQYGADDAFPIEDIDEILPGLMEQRSQIFYSMGTHLDFDPRILSWVNGLRVQSRQGAGGLQEFVALNHVLDDMRLYKSRPEQVSLRRAAQIAVGAHRRAIRFARPGRMEYEVMAEVVHEFRSHNADISYHPIVGGGANACVMHYRDNDKPLCDGDLLLLDAGCEHDYYASDITRTFPVSGRFTAVQRAVYEVVLDAQIAAIDKVRSGNHWNEPHEAAIRVITQGLSKLGLIKGSVPKLIKEQAYLPFFNHRTGHWLGLDVHDVGDYKVGGEWRVLEPGMALTVEPGIYIRPSPKVPKEFWNIGIRIEDEVLVTQGAPEVLTGSLEKTPDAIEALR
ncbi:MAG TPA: aminopeptidase P N-terminal domain-containing protein [Steroidobacteraceae bacterium]|jgi:Xaa-Pro aminopeptidase|nr:aminopeptidase P N-terminal domain-containing protein [Steroidobacteraceae bacterium]